MRLVAVEEGSVRLSEGYRRALEELATGHDLGRVLTTVTAAVEDQHPGMLCSVLVLEDDGLHLRHVAAPSLPAVYVTAFDGIRIGAGAGSCGTAAHENRRVIVEDIGTDPLWADYRDLASRHGLKACWSQPVVSAKGAVLGTFATYHRRPHCPVDVELRLIESAAHVAGVAIERWRIDRDLRRVRDGLEREVAERTRRLQALASELSHVEERERRRLAADLHDRIGQTLSLARVRLDLLAERGPKAGWDAALEECGVLIDRARRESQQLTFELSPPMLYDLGLEAALEWLVEHYRDRLPIALEDDGQAKPLGMRVRSTLFRAVRELLFNVLKHARAHSCRLSLSRDGMGVRVEVVDDGSGFELAALDAAAENGGGFGLFNVREQLEALGGQLDIRSRPGEGTRVSLWGPVASDEMGVARCARR